MARLELAEAIRARLWAHLKTPTPPSLEQVRLELNESVVVLRSDYSGYLNTRVLAGLDGALPDGLKYVKLLPLRTTGHLLLIPVNRAGGGAVPVTRLDTGTYAMLPLRKALSSFDVDFPGKRSLRLPFALLPTGGERPSVVGVLAVARPGGKPPAQWRGTGAEGSGAEGMPAAPRRRGRQRTLGPGAGVNP